MSIERPPFLDIKRGMVYAILNPLNSMRGEVQGIDIREYSGPERGRFKAKKPL